MAESAKARHEPRRWLEDEIERLIDMWRRKPLLYDTKDENYYRPEKRKEAIDEMSAVLNISAADIQRKIENLRTYFGKEKGKISKSKKSGTAPEHLYVPKWSFYNSLLFLENHVTPRRVIIGSMGDASSSPASNENRGKPSSHSSKRLRVSEDSRLTETPMAKVRTLGHDHDPATRHPDSKHSDVVFGEYIGLTLMGIKDQRTKEYVKLEIQRALFNAQFQVPPTQAYLDAAQVGAAALSHSVSDFANTVSEVPADRNGTSPASSASDSS